MKTVFVKFMSSAHLQGGNVSMYVEPGGTTWLYAENLVHDYTAGKRLFLTREDAENWYTSLPGTGVGKLDNALRSLMGLDESEESENVY